MMQKERFGSFLREVQSTEFVDPGRLKVTVFTSEKCPFCEQAVSLVKDITTTLSYYDNVELSEVRVEDEPELAEKFEIMSLPTLLIGQCKINGLPNREEIEEMIHYSILGLYGL